MSLTFADTHNMVAYLNKSDVTKGFDQIIDFLNGSYIQYALTINPHIYVSCIKQFWNIVTVKQSNDVTSSAMASAVICLSTGKKFNFSKYIFESLVRNVDSSSKFYMYPRFLQLIIQNQLGDISSHTTKYISPVLTRKVFANMRRVGKGFSRVETPLFAGMLVIGENVEEVIAAEQVQDAVAVAAAQEGVTAAIEEDVQEQSIPSPTPPPHPPQDLPSTSSVQPTPPPSPQT
nr:hypothetical protein [Tanacetum cinerariifolium]